MTTMDVLREDGVTYGRSLPTNPFRALLDEVSRTAGHVAWLGLRVAECEAYELEDRESSASRWLQLYTAERRHLVHVCSQAVGLGLAEREVQLVARQAELQAQLLLRVVERLGLSAEQRSLLPDLLREELGQLEQARP